MPGLPSSSVGEPSSPGRPAIQGTKGAQLTDRAVLVFLANRAGPWGAVTLGCRTIAEHLGISKDTVSRSLRRLQREGLIELLPGRGRLTDAETWKVLRSVMGPPSGDLWSKDGLGYECLLLVEAMTLGVEYSKATLGHMTGLSRRRLTNGLNRLHSAGWILPTQLSRQGKPNPHTKWVKIAITPRDQEMMIDLLGVPERRLARRRKHRHQRIQWYEMVEPHHERTKVLHSDDQKPSDSEGPSPRP